MLEAITTWLIFIPTIAAVALLVLAKLFRYDHSAKFVALGATGLNLLLSLVALNSFEIGGGIQFQQNVLWIPRWGIQYSVGMDGLSLLMVILTNLLMLISVLSSFSAIRKRNWEYYFFMLILHTGINGTFCAFDLFAFYVFWEIMLIPMYFLIGIWGSERRIYATFKFVLYTLIGSLLMLIAILYVYFKVSAAGATPTYHYLDILRVLSSGDVTFSRVEEFYLFLAFFFAFAIKVPMFPFHTWLPDAHTEAPTAGSIILAGVLLKTGAYGILRFCIPFFPEAAIRLAPWISWLAVIAIIWGAATAIVQKDMKRLVAYSSVSHMGFIMLGFFAFTSIGLSGGVLQMINHGISTGGLFLGVGMLYERRHTRLMRDFGGLAHVMKRYAVAMMIIVLSSAGLPGLNGFVGEFLILVGTFTQQDAMGPWWTAIAATGIILGAVYLLIMVQRVFFGPLENPQNKDLPDLNFREVVTILPLIILAFWIGLYPKPWLNMIENSYGVRQIEQRIESVRIAQNAGETTPQLASSE